MKRILLALLLTPVPACFVDSNVAENPKSAETRISESGSDWCDGICQRIVACPLGECVCEEDFCDCPAPPDMETCLQDCSEYLETFVGHGEECAQAGLEQMSCLDNASCEELGTGGVCENAATPPACAGSTPVGIGCEIEGGTVGTTGGSAPLECTIDFMFCSDGHDYGVSCVQEAGETYRVCGCSTDQELTHSFNLPGLACPTEYDVNVGCGFELSLSSNDVPPPGECFGSTGSGSPASGQGFGCSSEFHCAAGVYSVICGLETGYPSCDCYFDGSHTQSFLVPDTICPGDGAQEDIARINAGCGFSLESLGP